MGEYITIGDMKIKVGVMDDFRYVRLEELQEFLYLAKETEEIQVYLDDPTTLYRFPFPWEDDKSFLHHGRDMFKTVSLNITPTMNDFEHGSIVKHVECSGGGHGVNVWIPCILGEDGRKHQTSGVRPVITIFGERKNCNGVYTVFRCGYCEKPFAMDEKGIEEIQNLNQKRYANDEEHWIHGVLKRLKPKKLEEVI